MMKSTEVLILKAMLEAGLEKIRELEGGSDSSEAEPKKKAAVAAPAPSKRKKKEAISTAAEESAETTSTPSEVMDMEAIDKESKNSVVTLEQIRSVLQEKRAAGKKDKFKELFAAFGVQRLPDVDPADYEKLLTAAEAL